MFSIPQSTSFTLVFKAFLSSDHVSEATGKTIAITISKAGGAFGNPNAGATNATEISSGWYKVTLDTTDTGTLGIIAIRGAAATIDDYGDRLFVVSATTGGLTNLDAAITSRMATYTQPTGFLAATFPATLASTTNITAGTITTVTTVTNQLTAAQIATGIWQDTTAGDFTTALSVGKSIMNGVALGTGLTVASVSGAVGSVTGAVGSVTGNVGGNVTGSVGSVVGLTASNLDATVSSRLASGSYTAPDNTSITAIKAKTDNLPAAPAAVGDIPTANQNADALLDRSAGIETNRTPRQGLRLMLAALAGKASGLATTTATFRDTNDSKDRIVATVDADGNRSAVTLDAS